MDPSLAIPLADIRAARERIADAIVRTPLVRLDVDSPCEIWLKLEALQPVGSFKLRGAANAIRSADPAALREGVSTASAGNMALGVAWNARRLGLRCRVVVPDHAPQAKLGAIERLGGEIVKVPFDHWWQILTGERAVGVPGHFVHPVSDPAVMAGNGTIGLEILEDLCAVDAVIVPFGGGGLSSGIASAIKQLEPRARVYACEVETAAPLAASMAAGGPREIEYRKSFVDGIGGRSILPGMWPRLTALLDGALVVSLEAIAQALRVLAQRAHVVAEGAGGAALAAALDGAAGTGRVVCIVSGGNIDPARLAAILRGDVRAADI